MWCRESFAAELAQPRHAISASSSPAGLLIELLLTLTGASCTAERGPETLHPQGGVIVVADVHDVIVGAGMIWVVNILISGLDMGWGSCSLTMDKQLKHEPVNFRLALED